MRSQRNEPQKPAEVHFIAVTVAVIFIYLLLSLFVQVSVTDIQWP